MYCGNCGAEVNIGAKFCNECGARIEAHQNDQEKSNKKVRKVVAKKASPDGNLQLQDRRDPSQTNAVSGADVIEQLKKNIVGIISAIAALILIVVMVKVNQPSHKVVGTWTVFEVTSTARLRDYPEEDFIIFEDGTFTSDGYGGTYTLSNEDGNRRIYFNLGGIFGTLVYDIEFQNGYMHLHDIDDDADAQVIYQKNS